MCFSLVVGFSLDVSPTTVRGRCLWEDPCPWSPPGSGEGTGGDNSGDGLATLSSMQGGCI
jgi:hypothetical protein